MALVDALEVLVLDILEVLLVVRPSNAPGADVLIFAFSATQFFNTAAIPILLLVLVAVIFFRVVTSVVGTPLVLLVALYISTPIVFCIDTSMVLYILNIT